jgi:LPS-assembly lipoprotein
MSITIARFTTLLLCASLASCGGWHLRGSQFAELGVSAIELRTSGAPTVDAELRRALSDSGVSVTNQAGKADAILVVSDEAFDRRVLSVDAATGKVREVEIGLRVAFQLLRPDGLEVTPLDTVQWERDFVFDELALLGTVEQETLLRQSLAEDAAYSLLLRLDALRTTTQR